MNRQRLIEIAQWIRDNCIVIDTETTGLGENDTIVELAAVCPITRATLMDTLVHPKSAMNAAAEKTHGISLHEAIKTGISPGSALAVLAASHMGYAYPANPQLYLAAFNRNFDARLITQTAFTSYQHPVDLDKTLYITRDAGISTCIMELANRYLHEHLEWDAEQSKFRRLSLEKCLEITGIQRKGQAHRALSDALAAADLLNYIAEGKQP